MRICVRRWRIIALVALVGEGVLAPLAGVPPIRAHAAFSATSRGDQPRLTRRHAVAVKSDSGASAPSTVPLMTTASGTPVPSSSVSATATSSITPTTATTGLIISTTATTSVGAPTAVASTPVASPTSTSESITTATASLATTTTTTAMTETATAAALASATVAVSTPKAAQSTRFRVIRAAAAMNATGTTAMGETIVVPFVDGPSGVQTTQSYSGPITLTVSGVGHLAGCQFSDAFYLYADCNDNPYTPPQHYTGRDNFGLQINLNQVDTLVQPVPTYRPDHTYTFPFTAPGGPLTLGGGDDGTYDNAGQYTVTITVPAAPSAPTPIIGGGAISWHPHQSVRFAAGLGASVDLADGHVDVSAADLNIPGRGPDLTLAHTWDSALAQADVTTTAGEGWVDSLTPQMGGSLTGVVTYQDDTGATWPFTYTGSLADTGPYTTYSTPPGLPWQLTASTAGYTLTDILTSETLTFDAQGRYRADTDAYGNNNTLSSGSDGPRGDTNSGGRALAFSYQHGLLADAQSPLWQSSGGARGQHVTYGYNGAGQLTAMTWGAGTSDALTATFGYSGTQLTTVTTGADHQWTLGYDAQGRLATITSPNAGQMRQAGYTPAYTTAFSYTAGQTQVVRGYGASGALTTTYTLDEQGEATSVADGLNDTTRMTYDQDHDVLSRIDANNNTTAYAYAYVGPNGSAGLVTQTVAPPIRAYTPFNGTLTPSITTNRYDPATYDLLETDKPEGGVTMYQYDGHHSVITTTELLAVVPAYSCPQFAATAQRHALVTSQPRRLSAAAAGTACRYSFTWRGSVTGYDAYGERVAATDGRGVDVADTHNTTPDPQGITPTVQLDPSAGSYTQQWSYDAQGDQTSASTPPLTTLQLDGTPTTAPVTTSSSYDADGNSTSTTSANGNTTTYAYDQLGRQVRTTLPAVTLYDGTTQAPTMTSGYDGDGNAVRQTDAVGEGTTSAYDALGRVISTTNPVSGTSLTTYNATEQVAAQDAQGNVTTSRYDDAGRLVLTTDPTGGVTQYGYDPAGKTLAITGGDGASVTTLETRGYDAQNHVIADTVGAPGSPTQTTTTSYDHDGNVAQVEQPNGDVTYNTYDLADQLLGVEIDPAAVTSATGNTYESYSYDHAGTVTESFDADKRDHKATAIDGDNRVLQRVDTTYGVTGTTTQGFDLDGNALQTTVQTQGPTGSVQTATSAMTVNPADWTATTTDNGQTTAYRYDAAGQRRTETILGGGTPIITTLDAEGRTTSIGESLGRTTPYDSGYSYNADDLPVTTTLPNGVTEATQYDGASRPVTVRATGLSPTTLARSSIAYGYNALGWTTGLTATIGASAPLTQRLTHDAQGRVTGAQGTGVGQGWRYDGSGNLHTATTNGVTTTYGYNASTPNELQTLAVPGQATRYYGYDGNGDTTSITSTGGLDTRLQYDSQARLVGVTVADGTQVTQTYNASGRGRIVVDILARDGVPAGAQTAPTSRRLIRYSCHVWYPNSP